MNFLWITLMSCCCIILSIAALPTQSPARQCLKFERRRSNNVGNKQQLNISDDNSISSNEYQGGEDEDGDNDYNKNEIHDYAENSTQDMQEAAAVNVTCPSSKNYCYSVWSMQSDGTTRVERQGCWEHPEQCEQSSCMGHPQQRLPIIYCCCNDDYCNSNFIQTTPKTSPVVVPPNQNKNNPQKFIFHNSAIWISFVSTGIMLIIIAVVFVVSCREKPLKVLQETSPLAPSGPGYSSNLYNVDNLKPISIIGEGKYGTVWKGMINEQPVAIKIFSANKKQYFLNEVDIFAQPFMDTSPALLTYFGCDERLNLNGKIEYLLVVSLAEYGSLFDYLRSNVVSFQIFSRMATSIARGISHLHTRIQKGDMVKMCIAHRDINSKNILVKADLSCCICDFGFAMKLNNSRYEYQGEMILAETKSIYEVGTLRYMAPEILEGAVNLKDCETSLKQIDVYSLGLVLWELCMRCHEFYPPEMPSPPYKAPYEAEIGIHPTVDQMRALVLQHKARPLFPPHWGGGTAAYAVKEVCEDCWDPDAEARLTSLCVEERLIEISTMKPRSHYVTVSTTPLNTNNNLNHVVSINIPPNQISTRVENTCETNLSPSSPSVEYFGMQKNREIYAQQIQPFQGRNLCLERNLVQIHQVDQSSCDDEKSVKKCPLSNGNKLINNSNGVDGYSWQNAEYEVLVEELLSSRNLSNASQSAAASLSQPPRDVLQKRVNVDKNKSSSRRWRDIIHKKFHLKRKNQPLNVDAVQPIFSSPVHKGQNLRVSEVVGIKPNNLQQRPRNLEIVSPIVIHTSPPSNEEIQSYKTPLNDPLSDSFAIVREPKMVTSKSASLASNSEKEATESKQLKRQRSLEVFREVFGPSKVNLRDVQCRVKTPGDLPASVRKVRASKTLSLYDDRIMDPKFIRDNSSL